MKHIIAFTIFVFIPLLLVHMHQRKNVDYQGFKKERLNYVGIFASITLFLFIFLADVIAPKFVFRYDLGWYKGRGNNEYTYAIKWFISLLLITFPHVCKRASWPLFHTAMQAQSKHNTHWYRLGGFVLVILLINQTINLSI